MELSYNELRDKEVISVREGKSLGRVSDLVFCYPEGVITGKIGRDVVIVDMRGGDRDDGRDHHRPPDRGCQPAPPPRPPRPQPRGDRSGDIYLDDYE